MCDRFANENLYDTRFERKRPLQLFAVRHNHFQIKVRSENYAFDCYTSKNTIVLLLPVKQSIVRVLIDTEHIKYSFS
jgi:hypothetical protein